MVQDILSMVVRAPGLAAITGMIICGPALADIDNRARVGATAPDGAPVAARSGVVTIDLLDAADLVTIVSPAGDIPAPGGMIAYEVRVTNGGPGTAVGVTVRAALPDGVVPGAAAASAGSFDPTRGEWRIAQLPVGQTATLRLEGTVAPGPSGSQLALVVAPATARNHDPAATGDLLRALLTTRSRRLVARDDDRRTPVDSARPVTAAINVLEGDTLEGVAVNPSDVLVDAPSMLPAGIALNADGSIDVARHTPPGAYDFQYRICERLDPTNCARADVRLLVERSRPRVSGTVFDDTDHDGVLDESDPGLADYRVALTDGIGGVLAEARTDERGRFTFQGFDAGQYALHAIDPLTGVGAGQVGVFTIGPDDVLIDRDMAVNPTGIVHDQASRAPLAGATIRLADASGTPLPDACLLPGQQSQVTGADGRYRLDIVAGAAAACPLERTVYRLLVVPPAGYVSTASPAAAPEPDALDVALCPGDAVIGGPCHVNEARVPLAEGDMRHFSAFALAAGDPPVRHNHVPLAPATQAMQGAVPDRACPAVSGQVFADADRDGVRDQTETGIAGARISVGSDVATTDEAGHYTIACVNGLSSEGAALVTLDEAGLSGDLRAVDGASRTVLVAPGAPARVDFAVAPLRIVSIDLAGTAFDPDAAAPQAALRNGIVAVALGALEGPSVLRLTYHRRDEPAGLVEARLDAIGALLSDEWERRGLAPSTIETRIVTAQ